MDLREEYQQNRGRYLKILSKKSNNCCFNCGVSDVEFHIHHIVPLSLGGTNHILNLSLLCLDCHGKIHQKDFLKMSELSKQSRLEKIKKPHLPPDEELVPLLIERVVKSEADKASIAKIKKEVMDTYYVSIKEKKRLGYAIRFVGKARLYNHFSFLRHDDAWELFKTGNYVEYLQTTKREFSPKEIPLSLQGKIS